MEGIPQLEVRYVKALSQAGLEARGICNLVASMVRKQELHSKEVFGVAVTTWLSGSMLAASLKTALHSFPDLPDTLLVSRWHKIEVLTT